MLIVIVHPEQWNGGSDRCSLGLIRHFNQSGHRIVWYTTMIDKYWDKEEFEGVEIRVSKMALHPGDWFTQNVAIAWRLLFSDLNPDLIIIDHSASCVPMLKWKFPNVKILFYCHFPQQLVTPSRFFLYRWYANGIGLVEDFLFQKVDTIMVNSNFTTNLKARNRFPRILLAGSVMPTIPESKIYFDLLRKMADDLNVSDLVEFVASPTETEKFELYRECDTVIYTPADEHFGIVPIEALEQRRPVIACDSGGPAETVLEDITGSKIHHPDGNLLADAMEKHMLKAVWPALDNDADFDHHQRKRFELNFSLKGFGDRIDETIAMMFPGQYVPSRGARRRQA